MISQSEATAIKIDKTTMHITTIVDPVVRSTVGLVTVRNDMQPKMCSNPKQMNPSKRMNNKNSGGNPIVQPRDQLLYVFAEGNKQRPSQ
jgi:hypothetical protein